MTLNDPTGGYPSGTAPASTLPSPDGIHQGPAAVDQALTADPAPSPPGVDMLPPSRPAGPTPPRVDDDGTLDFSDEEPLVPVRFRIGKEDTRLGAASDDDVFYAAPKMPTGIAFDFDQVTAGLSADLNDREAARQELTAALGLFEKLLLDGQYERFHARLYDVRRPIDPKQLWRIMAGLMGRYGMRPTGPPPGSSDGSGSPAGGTSSTAGPPSPGSTSESSPSTASSTSPTPPSSGP
jgi:hypothetical protein